MEAILKKFGRKVRTLRQEQGLSQEELAHKAGLHYTYIGSVERGEANLTLRNIEKIANALGVKLPELFSFATTREKTPKSLLRVKRQLFSLIKDEDLETSRDIIKVVKCVLSLRQKVTRG